MSIRWSEEHGTTWFRLRPIDFRHASDGNNRSEEMVPKGSFRRSERSRIRWFLFGETGLVQHVDPMDFRRRDLFYFRAMLETQRWLKRDVSSMNAKSELIYYSSNPRRVRSTLTSLVKGIKGYLKVMIMTGAKLYYHKEVMPKWFITRRRAEMKDSPFGEKKINESFQIRLGSPQDIIMILELVDDGPECQWHVTSSFFSVSQRVLIRRSEGSVTAEVSSVQKEYHPRYQI